MMDYPDYVVEAIRGRLGLDPDDNCRDDEISKMSRFEIFDHVVQWEGIIGYTRAIMTWAEDIFKVQLCEEPKRTLADLTKKASQMFEKLPDNNARLSDHLNKFARELQEDLCSLCVSDKPECLNCPVGQAIVLINNLIPIVLKQEDKIHREYSLSDKLRDLADRLDRILDDQIAQALCSPTDDLIFAGKLIKEHEEYKKVFKEKGSSYNYIEKKLEKFRGENNVSKG